MIVTGITGITYQLGEKIGEGGEGAVYAVTGHPALLAKIYHQPLDTAKYHKLQALVKLQSEDLLRVAAWPLDVLTNSSADHPIGFLMPRVEGAKEVHLLYGPTSRINAFNAAHWKFLVRAAMNITRAFGVMHQQGHVIGDVNHGSILVQQNATVKLIDCDSFQVQAGETCFRCDVGVGTHTPPELQGIAFRDVMRTVNHDGFGLAVTIFQLLFLGRHPFAGIYPANPELSLEERIACGLFAYDSQAQQRGVQQPPKTPHLETVGPAVARLFERAFSVECMTNQQRPTALEWLRELDALEKSLLVCPADDAHYYYQGLPACPWCEIERQVTFRLFALVATDAAPVASRMDLHKVWETIAKLELPTLSLTNAQPASPPDPAIARLRRQMLARLGLLAGAVVALAILALFVPVPAWGYLAAVVLLAGGGVAMLAPWQQRRAHAAIAVRQTRARLAELKEQWRVAMMIEEFHGLKRDLAEIKQTYYQLQDYRNTLLEELKSTAYERQRENFLTQHTIAHARIPGIGPSQCALLGSWGITTAADVIRQSLCEVPGVSAALAERLLNWRKEILLQFTFDPDNVLTPGEVRQVEQKIEHRRAQLEKAMITGRARLLRIAKQAQETHQQLARRIEQYQRVVEEAEVNLAAYKLF